MPFSSSTARTFRGNDSAPKSVSKSLIEPIFPCRARQSFEPKSMSSVKVPVSRPKASDPYAMTPMPCSSQYGKTSSCIRRSNMCQPYCATSTRRTRMHASMSSFLKFETPMKRALPASTTSSSAPIVSSNGVSRSGQCTM